MVSFTWFAQLALTASPVAPTVFTPGTMHDHRPSGRWKDVQKDPNSGFWENRACANFEPKTVIDMAIKAKFSDKPIARDHLNWYLSTGGGKDFVEDANLEKLVRSGARLRGILAGLIPTVAPASATFSGSFKVEQSDYDGDSKGQDFRFAFGAIDRLDFQVDYTARTVHLWFQDRYEWHPVYPFYPGW
jgi:hypothetical protein